MSGQTSSPDPATPVVEYRSDRWAFIGGLALFVLFGLAAVFPDVGNPSGSSKSKNLPPEAAAFLFGAVALIGLLFMVGSVPRMHRFFVDHRGLSWQAGRKFDLIAWDEVRAVRGQEPRPPVKDDPTSKALMPALVFTPADGGFANRHSALVKPVPDTHSQVALRLPNTAAVRRLTQEIARVRPDLLH